MCIPECLQCVWISQQGFLERYGVLVAVGYDGKVGGIPQGIQDDLVIFRELFLDIFVVFHFLSDGTEFFR